MYVPANDFSLVIAYLVQEYFLAIMQVPAKIVSPLTVSAVLSNVIFI